MRLTNWRDSVQAVRRWPRWKRYALAAVVSPTLLVGLVALAFYGNLHRRASAMSSVALPNFPKPTVKQRLLIISPHLDDETLGVGGLISEARKAGIPVQIVFLTNGDAFPAACVLVNGNLHPESKDYVHLGEVRQKEALAALHELGIGPDDVTFLGYPDQGMRALWETNWSPQNPYRSRFTQRSSTPRGPYCGEAVLQDLSESIRRFQPTDIYVTHPADDHQDHSLAAAFTQAALQTQVALPKPNLHYYIVHRGDWPLPQGYSPHLPMIPPAGLTHADTFWRSLPLTSDAQRAKRRALNQYPSQLELCGRQLRSFLRENEIFGELPISEIEPGKIGVVRDAQGDDVFRFANPATDISQLTARQVDSALEVVVKLRGAASPGVRYGIHIRSSDGGFVARTLLSPSLTQTGIRTIHCSIPLTEILKKTQSPKTLWISADTGMTARFTVDQTGYRQFLLRPVSNKY